MPADDPRRIGANIRAARLYRGMSLDVLGGLIGRSKGWLSRVENGHLRLERRTDIRALAEALGVSATDLLGEPAPVVRPENRAYGDIVRLREVLLDSTLDDPLDLPARALPVLADLADGPIHRARKASDYAALALSLPPVLAELHVHAARGDELTRTTALGLLVEMCTSATFVLRHLGQVDLAWIAADRAAQAARLLDDAVLIGASTFARAHARPSAALARSLREAQRSAGLLEPHLGDDRKAHEVYGMLQLSAALASQIEGDLRGADRHVEEAERIAERLGEQPPSSPGDGWQSFGRANVGVWRAMLAVESGEPETALRTAERVDFAALPTHGRKAALAIEMGRAYAMLGRTTEAVRELRRAEKLEAAHVHKSPIVRDLVADLHNRATSRDLRGLAWRMNLQ
ncbi:helix-turn-helix domain-containing protein [Actinomadura roseirufa]|uniref:helix-turn-helix domain-containing protein n=1 Tax=Actinomadura roseirufa TaxID=2094049 RepID=UPI001040E759|nr:helix-turn-helix transcriptional regulator [Actinomadura roseirufa]